MVEQSRHQGGAVVTLTINRPEKRNALNREVVDSLREAIRALSADKDVRVLILTGAGKAFSAGADLKALEEMQTASRAENLDDSQALADLYNAIRGATQPVIARVNGHAIAGGLGLVAACDFAICVNGAKLGFTEVRIGMVPAIVSVILKRRLRDLDVRNLFLRGHLITAAEAVDVGLLNAVVNPDELDTAVNELATEIISNCSTEAIAQTKKLLRQLDDLTWEDGMARAVHANADARGTDDCRAGITAFLNRESPPWAKSADS